MLDRTSDLSACLEKARADLQIVEAELRTIASEKPAASVSREAFEQWRTDDAAATAEKERLVLLIATLEAQVAQTKAAAAKDELRKRHAAKVAENEKLAVRIRADVAKANAIMLALLRDVAQSVAADQAINAELPEDLEPLIPANSLARSRLGLPRQEISRERLWLWTRNDTGAVVGDQAAVRDLGEGRGIIEYPDHTRRPATRCRRLLFEQISYHPAQPAEPAAPLWQVRLVCPDAPGVQFDGTDFRQPREVLMALDRAARAVVARERPIESEIVPLGRDPR